MMFFLGLFLVFVGYMINGSLIAYMIKRYETVNPSRGKLLNQEIVYFSAWCRNSLKK